MSDRNLRLPAVIDIAGLSKSEIYRRVKAGEFPPPCRLSHKVSVWSEAAVEAWKAASRMPADAKALLA